MKQKKVEIVKLWFSKPFGLEKKRNREREKEEKKEGEKRKKKREEVKRKKRNEEKKEKQKKESFQVLASCFTLPFIISYIWDCLSLFYLIKT